MTLAATVTGAARPSVQWTVEEGEAGGAIDATGTYVAPTTAGTYTVVAASLSADLLAQYRAKVKK